MAGKESRENRRGLELEGTVLMRGERGIKAPALAKTLPPAPEATADKTAGKPSAKLASNREAPKFKISKVIESGAEAHAVQTLARGRKAQVCGSNKLCKYCLTM